MIIVSLSYYSYPIILTKNASSTTGRCVVMQAMGPGFDSQVPHILHNFVYNAFRCNSLPVVHQTPQRLCLPHVSRDQSNGQNGRITMDASQSSHTRAGKSQTGLEFSGPNSLHIPPNWVQTPQGLIILLILFFLYLFFFFYFFNCYFD